MAERYRIPMKYKEGIYGIKDFEKSNEDAIELEYEEIGEIVTYQIPDYEYDTEIVLYSIPKDKLEKTLRAFYSENGHLRKITICVEDKEILVYIHYENIEDAKEKIQSFAIKNADSIIEKICMCNEVVSRLFVEYFNDGQYLDFHAKIGTEAQKKILEKKYPDYEDIGDSCGDYPVEYIKEGNNDELKVMVLCADNDKMDFFQFAVDIMVGQIAEKAVKKLNKADDFMFICDEYD